MLLESVLAWSLLGSGGGAVAPKTDRLAVPRLLVAQTEGEVGEGGAKRIRRDGMRDMIRRPGVVPRRPGGVTADEPQNQTPPPPAPGATPAPGMPGAAPAAPQRPAAPAQAQAPAANSEVDFEERAKKGKFSFDFAKAEIMDIVKAISDMTRRNFIIPEKIKSQRITILSPTKITASEAWQVFLAALEVNGITIARSGKFYKLLESKDAIKENIPTCVGVDAEDCPKYSEQMVTTIVPMKYIDAQTTLPIIKSLLSKESEVQAFAPSNSLIVSEYAHNLTRVRKILDTLDVPGFDDELQIVQINYATATEIADKLTQIFDVQGRGASGGTGTQRQSGRNRSAPPPDGGAPPVAGGGGEEGESEVQISKIIADDRTNQLIIKANRRSFEAIRNLIAKLDIPLSDTEQGRVHVYYLENAKAEDLSSTLSSLSQGQPTSQRRQGAGAGGGRAGQPAGQQAEGGRAGGGEAAVLFEGEIKVTADKSTNSLVIVANGRDYRALVKIIQQLDTPRRQVYVEAAILEVNVGDNTDFGLNYHVPGRSSTTNPPFGVDALGGAIGFAQSAFGGSGISPTLTNLTPQGLLGIVNGALVGVVGRGVQIDVGNGDPITLPSFGVVLKWLETSSNTQILSTPHILTTDNEEATIEVGQKIPFQRGTSIPSNLSSFASGAQSSALNQLSGLGSVFSSVDRIDVSLKLKLTPQINERGKIRLEIDQQIEDLADPGQANSGTPATTNRAAKTVVVVDDQQTVVLGGLIRDRVGESESKVPILGDLPILGWLFKTRRKQIEKVNLLLVLTPYIIRDSADFQTIFERKIREYEEFAAEYYSNLPQYRAYIDYSRKSGPLAKLAQTVKREQAKPENGGKDDSGDVIIEPSQPEPNQPMMLVPNGAASETPSGAPAETAPQTPSGALPEPTPSELPQEPVVIPAPPPADMSAPVDGEADAPVQPEQ